MIHIVCFKWYNGEHPKKKIVFSSLYVNRLYNMVKRNTSLPFKFHCLTDSDKGLDPDINAIPLWFDYKENGGCWLHLRLFSEQMKGLIGDRIVMFDLDCVICGNIDHLLKREEDFLIWGEDWRLTPYCGSFLMMDAGCRSHVWENFNIKDYPPNRPGKWGWSKGTDQQHISKVIPNEVTVGNKEGIYNFAYDILELENPAKKKSGIRQGVKKIKGGNGELPENCCIVFFNGKYDPADTELQWRYSWIKENWK